MDKVYEQRQKLNDSTDSMSDLKYDWFNIYRNKPSWSDYTYRAINGKQTRALKRLNLPKTITNELNKLIFAETPDINVPKAIQDIFDNNKLIKNLKDWNEYLNVLGGGALKIFNTDDGVTIDFVKSHNFVPVSWNNRGIYEADFYSDVKNKSHKYTLIEQHRVNNTGYTITTILKENGVVVPLSNYSDTIEQSVDIITDYPLFTYVHSIVTNNLNSESPETISIFANSVDVLEECDKCYDALCSEIRLGKKRLIVPTNAIQKVYDATLEKFVNYFDESDEIYSALNVEDTEALKFIDNSGTLRITELVNALNTNLKTLSFKLGMNNDFLSFDVNGGLKTATEVISDNSKSFRTSSLMKRNLEEGLMSLTHSIISYLAGIGQIITDDYSITFQDNVIEDRNSKATYWHNRLLNKTCTVEDVLIHLDGLTPEEAKIKADLIKASEPEVNISNPFGVE